MSRTYRHRHTVPKGYKAVDRAGHIVTIDENGEAVWTQDHGGRSVTWRRYAPQGTWVPGHGWESSMLERWKLSWFGKRKIPTVSHCIRDYDNYSRYRSCKEWNHFEKKATRRRVKMRVRSEDFDLLPLTDGRQPAPTHAYRRPPRKYRTEQEDCLESGKGKKITPVQEE